MGTQSKEQLFTDVITEHRKVIVKVCYMYASDDNHFNDLYQEVLANVWQGIESFRGDSKISTWIYRTAINTCVTYFRHHGKLSGVMSPLSSDTDFPDDGQEKDDNLKFMYALISRLGKLDKALIMMWLDEYSYDEIAEMTGLTRTNVAAKLRRIKLKLTEQANQSNI